MTFDSYNASVPRSFTVYSAPVVTFNAQSGTTPSPASKTVTNHLAYGTLATTTRTGYTFAGWWTGTSGTGTQITSATTVNTTAAQTLYANWTANSYTVTFDAQGGTTPSPTSKAVTYASTYGTLATTTRAGYTFAGWWTGTGGTGTQITSATTVTITAAQTLYANWTPNSYTVTFDAQGGTTPSPTSKTVTYASTYGTLATTTRTGYTLAGWWTGTNGTGTQITSATTVTITAPQTLYAKWTLLTTTHGTSYLWLDQYGLVSGGNYEAADVSDKDGDGYAAWQEYIAGTVPTNRASVFKALITKSNGVPRVAWTPDLGTARVYTVEGRTNLNVGVWGTTNASSRFFRVNVGMP